LAGQLCAPLGDGTIEQHEEQAKKVAIIVAFRVSPISRRLPFA
jgi:hypothetical protein